MNRSFFFYPAASLVLVFAILSTAAMGQVPTKCLEIESILVDACNPSPCNSNEGPNEMVRFRTGPTAIALNEITAEWPNPTNPWRGLTQSSQTASITAQLNATISSCGWLLEPPSGIIPPGSAVILITSTDICLSGITFAGLTDTLYLVFQTAGATAGHFANGPGGDVSATPPSGNTTRRTIMTYTPTNCSDTATYVVEQLVNIYGTYQGTAEERNGSTVQFSWPGVPVATYVNYGCQAPFEPVFVQPTAVGALCGGSGTVSVSGTVTGTAFTDVQWSGGTGTFGDPTALNTTYTAGPGDTGNVVLQLCAQTDCADPICGSVIIPAGSGPTPTITANGPLAICPGDPLVLTASGADSYVWGSGETTPSITVFNTGTFTVTGTNVCGTGSSSITVTQASGVTITISGNTQICPGETTVLTASGANSYVWSTFEFAPSITVSEPGTYSVTGSNNCGSATEAVVVTLGTAPNVIITGNTAICEGQTTTLTASGATGYVWSNAATTASITVSTGGTYSVVGTSGCGTATASTTVVLSALPEVTITGNAAICGGETTTLTATGADSFLWNTTATTAAITVDAAGTYSVTGTNACGTGSATITVVEGQLPTVQISGNGVLCPGDETVLTATSSSPVSWSTGATTPSITVDEAGTYTVTATNGCGSSSASLTVTEVQLVAAFQPTPAAGTAPLTVVFNNASVPTNATYSWDFDGPGMSTVTSPAQVFTQPGTYDVELTVTVNGCSVIATEVVTVTVVDTTAAPISVITLPNVFTPNGDRQNDLLVMNAVNITSVEVLIFNRWGQKVSELNRVGEAWDARSMSGELVPDGTYFYTLEARGADGVEHSLTGHITVLR